MRSVFFRGLLVLQLLVGAGIGSARTVDRYAANGWQLTIRHDAFADRVSCTLRSHDRRILFQPGAVGFRFRRRRDTLGAIYRIDGGAPRRWQDAYPQLITNGVDVEGPGLDDPTDGVVWVPIDELRGTRIVAVRANGRHDGRIFALRGFEAMRDAAQRLGCRSKADFGG